MDENEMNNIARFVLTALPHVQAFLRFLMKDGKVKHSLFFLSFPFPPLSLALLDNSA